MFNSGLFLSVHVAELSKCSFVQEFMQKVFKRAGHLWAGDEKPKSKVVLNFQQAFNAASFIRGEYDESKQHTIKDK